MAGVAWVGLRGLRPGAAGAVCAVRRDPVGGEAVVMSPTPLPGYKFDWLLPGYKFDWLEKNEYRRTPEQLDLAVWPIFARMTARGLRVDTAAMTRLAEEVEDELAVQEAALEIYAGRKLNPYSPDDVGKWLKSEGLPVKHRRNGGIVTDERALSQLTDMHPVPGCVLECRGLRKLVGTFIDPVLEIAARTGGVVHPRWRLTKVKSGRPSCEDPNLLAFPTRDAWGKRVRDCFVARPGHKLVSVDFSQIEPRIAAALSGDAALCAVFAEGRDLYADMARRIFRLNDPDAMFKLEPLKTRCRQPAKIVLLGCVLYGMGPELLYDELVKFGCGTPSEPFYDIAACEDFVRRRFEPYPGVGKLFAETVRIARMRDGQAETMGGRRRFLPALLCDGPRWPASKLREESERQAFNHLIQGTAQEVMKEAMLRVDAHIARAGWAVHPLLQIYDELIFEVAESCIGVAPTLADIMETQMEGVAIETSYSVADSWGALK
jgi:DNA polymerase-1